MYAVIKTDGKQYKVAAGGKLKVESLPVDVGGEVEIKDVLMVADGADLQGVRAALFDALVASDVPTVGNILPPETTPPPAGSVLNPSAIWAARSAASPAPHRRIAP